MDVIFLSVSDVLAIHQIQVDRWGGASGLREAGLLDSAVNTPRATFGGEYLNADLCEMAAAYVVSLVVNHPFVDGNKRTGITTAAAFLSLNGVGLTADEARLTQVVLDVAAGRMKKGELAEFLRANTTAQAD